MTEQYIRDKITSLRLERNISEYLLSLELGHSRGYINNISSGKALPSMSEFLKICDYFEITPRIFFDEEGANSDMISKMESELKEMDLEEQIVIYNLIRQMNKKTNRKYYL